MQISLILAAAFTSVVSASPPGYGHHPPPPYSQCWTLRGSKPSPHVPTSYTTTTTPCTSTATSSTTITTTLVPVTGTITVTETSTNSLVSTSTVPTAAGFLPVQTTLPDSSYSGSGGPDPVNKRTLPNVNGDVAALKGALLHGGVKNPPRYPSKVTCKKWHPSPTCTTTTTTVTSTSTITPAESYTTVTTTTTTTSYTSTTTLYAACASNNLIDTVTQGTTNYGISNIIPTPGGGAYPEYEIEGSASAYDCCVFGLLGPDPGIIFAYTIGDGTCIIGANNGVCPATGQATNPAAVVLQSGGMTYVTGNLPCGEITGVS